MALTLETNEINKSKFELVCNDLIPFYKRTLEKVGIDNRNTLIDFILASDNSLK